LPADRLVLQGLAGAQSPADNQVRAGALALLSLPAHDAVEQRELSAAALYYAARALDKLKDSGGATAVRRELTTRFSGTKFGSLPREQRSR
jgi:hypothetical protein